MTAACAVGEYQKVVRFGLCICRSSYFFLFFSVVKPKCVTLFTLKYCYILVLVYAHGYFGGMCGHGLARCYFCCSGDGDEAITFKFRFSRVLRKIFKYNAAA